MIKLSTLHPKDDNPRQITPENLEKLKRSITDFEKMMELRPMVVDEDGQILGGNMRYRGLIALGYTEVPDEWVKVASGLTEAEKLEFVIKDNVSFGVWDFDALANGWEIDDLAEWGVDDVPWEGDNSITEGPTDEELEEIYSTKVEAPVYEPSGQVPAFEEMYDTTKTDELLNGINATDMPEEVKRFLEMAAYRHTVINFEKVADFYAQAPAYIQELMEDSALVIIDFEKAIEKGYVQLNKSLGKVFRKDVTNGDEE